MTTIRRYASRRPAHLVLAFVAAIILVAGRGSGHLGLLQAQVNPIPAENLLEGTPRTEWEVFGNGDPAIQGFATDMSVNVGGTVDFKVDVNPGTPFHLDIYRLGYYQTNGARHITSIENRPGTAQGSCLPDAATGLVDCGNWTVSASWAVPADAVSGVYIAKAVRDGTHNFAETEGASHIVFVVRDDSRPADVLLQTSDTTWQAYNKYGGASLYCGGPVTNTGAYAQSCPGRATKVSYNRPFDTRGHSPQSYFFNADYPMIRFLEANGYNVKYWSGVDTDRRGAALSGAVKPKTFISVGHDEYWSGNQRTAVENARAAGVNLAFFSGNEVYWKTRWEASLATGTAHRTLVTYKDTIAGVKLDPEPNVTTGTWRDTRFGPPNDGGRPENALIGSIWTVNNGTSAITVPASMKSMRLWQNTRVAALQSGEAILAPGSLGYEWGEDLDNGFRPAGVFHLSSTTVNNVEKIIDFGATVGMGNATHHLTLYRHGSALVFGASTVQWAWGLDREHDDNQFSPHSHTPDQAMQQATVNLLADMGAQPSTLRIGDGLFSATQSTDSVPPSSTIMSPTSGQFEGGSPVVISGTANDQQGQIAGVEVSVDGGATWHAAQGRTAWTYNWVPGAAGSVNIRSRAVDDSGNLETPSGGVTVSVVSCLYPCPSLWRPTQVPTNLDAGAATLELGVRFKSDIDGFITGVRFYKSTANAGTVQNPHTGSLWSATGTRLATAVFTSETPSGWQEVTFDPPVAILANTTYVASYFAPFGHYSYDSFYFDNRTVDSPPLHALAGDGSTEVGGNGLYFNGGSGFPTSSFHATNYWVDVVFTPTLQDAIPPVISSIKATTIDSSKVKVSWSTNEDTKWRLDYGTDPNILSDTIPPAGTLSVINNSFATQHSVTLTGLQPNTTYYYRITAIDRSANQTVALPPTFTVPGPTLRDTASTDFAVGTPTGTYVSESSDGEVILTPTIGSEFSGPSLPAGWIVVPWSQAGYSAIENGVLVVDGARVATCQIGTNGACLPGETTTSTPSAAFTTGHSLDFSARFSGSSFQHAGFGVTFADASEPWAIFSVMPTQTGGVELFARTNLNGGGGGTTSLGTGLLGAFHRYRVDWNVNSVDYYVDGAVVAQHALTVAGPMRPVAASDFDEFGGTVFVDWMRMTPNVTPGAFVSRVFDATSPVDWKSIQWASKTPPGTALTISVRTGDTPTPPQIPDGTWTSFATVASAGPLSLHSRYIQYRVDMTTTDPHKTPELEDIIISTGSAPIAAPDFAALSKNTTHTFPPSGLGSLTANDTDADPTDTLSVAAVTQPAHGSAVVNADGSVVYTPVANYFGPDAFTYTVTDGLLTSSATVTIDVRDGNVPPVSNNDFFAVNEEATLTVPAPGILANDTDVEHNPLTAVLVTFPTHGMLTFQTNGAFTYTPALNYAGPDSFTYLAHDGLDASAIAATVNILVNQVNDPPYTLADSFNAMLNMPLDVPAPGVLANDRDVEVEDTAPLHAQLVSTTTHGLLTLNSNGSFSYVPEADFLGTDSFTYSAVDHFDAVGAPTTVTLTVAIKSVSQSVASGTVSTGTGVSVGDPLNTAVTTSTPAIVKIAQGVIADSTSPTGFTFLNQQVNITLTHPTTGLEVTATEANPLVFTFEIDLSLMPPGQNEQTFQVFRNGMVVPNCLGATTIPSGMDPCVSGRSNGTKVQLTILTTHASHWNMGLGTPPLTDNLFAFNDPTYVTNYQTPLEVATNNGVSMNDVGPGHLFVTLAASPAPYGGTVDLRESGAFDFTPNAGFCGVATFTYELRTDSLGVTAVPAFDTAVATIKVNCIPVAATDVATVPEDSGPTMIDVRFNDSDPDQPVSPLLAITAVTQGTNGTVVIGGSVTTPPGGAWVSYQPNPNFFGTDSFTYTIRDNSGDTATGTVNMTVTPVNDVPSFVKGADQTVAEDAALQTVPGWATALNTGAPNEAESLTFTAVSSNPGLFMDQPAVDAAGTLTYRPAANANGAASVSVYVKDNGGTAGGGIDTSAAQLFNITVTAVNDAPVADDQTVNASEDTAAAITLTASDVDSTALSYSIVQVPLHGTLSGTAPNLSYLPEGNYNGPDSFTFKVNDGALDSAANGTVSIVVGAVNDPPAATPQTVTTDEDVAKAITLAGTDIDSPQASLTYSVVANPIHGGLTGTPPNVTYTPAPDYNGADSFVFKANDGSLDSTPAIVSINVTPVNDAPVATPQSISTGEDTDSAAFTLAATDIDSASLTYSIVNGPTHGTLIGSAPNLTYRPAADYNGDDSFTFKANDGSLDSNIGTVTVTVTPVNDPPTASAGAVTTNEDNAVSGTVAATDIDANALTYSIVGNGTTGSATITNAATGAFTYTPNLNANGTDSFTFKANDGTVDSSVATMTVTITAVNDDPVSSDASITTNEDTAKTGTLGATDVDGNTLSYSIVANGTKGSAAITNAATGAFTYTPNADANGSDSFTFRVNDGAVNSNTATISVTITPANDAPSASNGTLTATEDVAANGTLSATDIDGDALTYSVVTNGTKGTAVVTNPDTGAYTYTPAANAYGTDTFTFGANDGTVNSANATVTVTINGINDPPSFTKGADQTIYGLAGLQSIANWATNLSVGPGETGQTLAFTVTNNNNALFTTQPAVAANGTLTYAPSNVLGTAIVTVVLKDNAGGADTSPAQTFNITVNKSATTTAVSSSSNPALFGVPLVLTATVTPIAPGVGVPGGSVTFKRGTTTIGSAGLVGNVATLTTATLPVGTHAITAVYGGNTNYNTSTSAAMSQVIENSGKLDVTFTMFEIKDNNKFPKIGKVPVAGGLVRVYTRKDVCTNGVIVSMSPKMWGKIFDGLDGPGGTDPGCPVVSVGSYKAEGVTAANGTVTISVPPTSTNPNEDYVVIGRTEGHDYFGLSVDPDTIYAAAMVRNLQANQTKKVGLFQLRLFNGKKIPGNVTEEFGSYLAIVQPEFMEFTDNQEQYPFVMVAEEGDWNVTTSVTPPEGFIPDLPALEVSAPNGTVTAMQFTVTDIASEWTETTVNHNIKHLGETRLRTEKVSMFDKKATLARPDSRKVMHDSAETIVDVMTNDRFAHTNAPISITASTPALNGNAVLNPDGYFGYTPNPGFTGTDTFTYTITDAAGSSSTATVTMTVLSLPEVSVSAATRIEGNSGQSTMTLNVKLSNQSLETVTVDYQTVNSTATAGADYVAKSGSLTFAPLTTTMPVTVQVIGDTLAEAHEKFFVRVSNPTNAQIAANPDGVATITDDDVPEISIAATASITEGNTGVDNVAINVTLSQSHEESVWVSYATSPVTAQPGSDYNHTTGTLQFLPGMTTRTIYVPVIFDTVGEANETLYVDLNTPLNATLTAATKAIVTIIDNDSTNWVTSTTAEFGAGTVDAGAYLAATSNGEVTLRPAMADEFFGPSVPAGWTKTVLEAGGATGIASGQLTVDGAAFQGPGTGVAGRTLEFSATFSGIDQSIGFAATTSPVAPMAMFVIKPNNELYAISINGNGARWEESPMAGINWRNQKLNFKIVWSAGSVQYYIGTTLMITHSNMAYGTVAMTPVVIDGHAGGVSVTVDWMRLTPYALAGTYTSAVFNAGSTVTWQKLTASASVVSGTTLTHTYRTGNTPNPEDGTWTAFTAVGANGVIVGSSQYIQFRSAGTSNNVTKTPILNDVTVAYKR